MLDILDAGSTFMAVSTLSALPLELDEQALPDERQKPLSAMTRRNTSDGTGFAQILIMKGEKSSPLLQEGDINVYPLSVAAFSILVLKAKILLNKASLFSNAT